MQDAHDYAVDTYRHPRGWIVVPVWAGAMYRIEFVLNTGYLMSALNSRNRIVLSAMGLLQPVDARVFSLGDLTLGGRPLPALSVHASRALELIEVESILGLDFLQQFTDVHFNVPAGRLVLRR